MTSLTLTTACPCEGTSALAYAPAAPRLVLIEGGLDRTRRQQTPQARLSARQTALLVVAGALVVIAACLAALVSDALASSAAADALSGAATQTVVVRPGDSLWEIAERSQVAGASTSEVVSWIEAANGLSDSSLSVGQRIVVPVS